MRRRAPLAALVLMLMVVAACGISSVSSASISHPAGPSLELFGLRERCPQAGECSDRAIEALTAALSRLGPEIPNAPITSPGGAPAAPPVPEDRLVVEVMVDPMLDWQATTGPAGSGSAFRVDLTDQIPYVVVAPRYAFQLSDQDAAAIRDALFVDR